jgi:hypothetical protein
MRPIVGVVLLLVSSAHAEETTPFTCTKQTSHECLLELPGDIVVLSGTKIRLPEPLKQGEFNQPAFNRAAQEKCGDVQ